MTIMSNTVCSFDIAKASKLIESLREDLLDEAADNIKENLDKASCDGFLFSSDKSDLCADIRRIDTLELTHVDNKDYLFAVASKLSACIEDYIKANGVKMDLFKWPLVTESTSIDSFENKQEYDFFVTKYYVELKDSIWKDDFNTAIDSISALVDLSCKDIVNV